MNLQGTTPLQEARAYRLRSQEYLRNAYLSLEQNELEKAGEFGWGAMAQAVKAVAALKGIALRQHRALWEFTEDLAKELGEQSIFEDFQRAIGLHRNFYEAGLFQEEVSESLDRTRDTVGKLLSILPGEVQQA